MIVLHQKAATARPDYKRYPRIRALRRCAAPASCNNAREDIINAFDNTIAYTDFF